MSDKDLDWSDVEADADRMEAMQELLPEALEVLSRMKAECMTSTMKWTGEFTWTNDQGEEDDPDGEVLWFKYEDDEKNVLWARLDDDKFWALDAEEWGDNDDY